MRRNWVVKGLVLWGLATTQALAATAGSATANLEKRLAQWEGLQGHFKQEIYGDTEELMDATQGKVYLKKPGKLRWEVTSRDKSLIVSDGKQIWHYDPELQQATVEAFNEKGTSPLLFLSAKHPHLAKHFRVQEVSHLLCHAQAEACFEMTPHSQDEMFQWIRIGFSRGGGPSGLEFLDQMGQHGWIRFSKMQVNQPMSDSLFRFHPPKGTDVLRRP